MPDSYVETITKLQNQGLETLKTAQESHLATLASLREIAANMAPPSAVPTNDGIPSIATLAELTTSFSNAVLEQQKAYATQLASIFAAAQTDASEAGIRAINQVTNR